MEEGTLLFLSTDKIANQGFIRIYFFLIFIKLYPQLVLLAVALTYPTLQAEQEYWRGFSSCSFFCLKGQSLALLIWWSATEMQ